MPVLRIKDLAEVMIEVLAPKFGYDSEQIEIKVVGVKPGEKLYEELMSGEETRRAVELKKYFVVLPAFRSIYKEIEYSYEDMVSNQVSRPYISEQESFMIQNEIKVVLEENDLIAPFEKSAHPAERYWP
jgi:FlaA1/EpsC-like NDP-sugar epimerase